MPDPDPCRPIYDLDLADVDNPHLQGILADWTQEARSGHPSFEDFDILDYPALAPVMVFIEKADNGLIENVTYGGSSIIPMAGKEMAGLKLAEFLPDKEHVDFLIEKTTQMARDGQPRYWHETLYWRDQDHVAFEILGLPFADSQGENTYAVFCFNLHT